MNRPDIKNYFPEDTGYMDVVKSALENPWYKYATQLDMFIDELLEKVESSSRIISESKANGCCEACYRGSLIHGEDWVCGEHTIVT